MTFSDTAAIAINAIFVNKSRSFLTMLGVIIGVGAVILLMAIGNGIQSYVTSQFNALGANRITILPGDVFTTGRDGQRSFVGREEQQAAIANNKLRLSDMQDLQRLRPEVQYVAPVLNSVARVDYQQQSKQTTIIGSNEDYEIVRNIEIEKGSFFTRDDDVNRRKVVVIGHDLAEELFDDVDPIGKSVSLAGQSLRVVGKVKKIGGGFGGPSFDSYAYMPLGTYRTVFNSEAVSQFIVQARDKESVGQAIARVEETLGKRLDENEFSVFETTEILNVINQILGILTVGLGSIAAISLVVGGIGIMNIMLVSVTERTREIGLRKAIGATPNVILLQFLIESATLSILGGLIGIGIAFLLTLIINRFFPASMTLESVLLAAGVSAFIGILFGVAPARRASKLSPIEALRYE